MGEVFFLTAEKVGMMILFIAIGYFMRRHHDLPENAGGREYFCMKAQGLLLSYLTTAMLVEPDKKKGRLLAAQMMARFRTAMPRAYELAKKQYLAYRAMNRLHISSTLIPMTRHKQLNS